MDADWPEWLTQDRLAELEAAAAATPPGEFCACCGPGMCPVCGSAQRGPCECPDAAVGLAVLLAARREASRDG